MSSIDEVGADGLTVREAISRRVLLGIERLVKAHHVEGLPFHAMKLSIEVLVDVNLPFCDSDTKRVLTEAIQELERQAQAINQEAEAEINRMLG